MKKLFAMLGVTDRDSFCAFAVQFVKFGIVGVSNTAIFLGIYYLCIFIDPNLYMLGNVAGWIISVLNAFFWGNYVVFKSEDNTPGEILRRLLKSYLTYGATFLLTTVLLVLEIEVLHWSEWISPLVNLCLTIPLNFLINKFWTFR